MLAGEDGKIEVSVEIKSKANDSDSESNASETEDTDEENQTPSKRPKLEQNPMKTNEIKNG